MTLASKLAQIDHEAERPQRGPQGECARIYGAGTLEDWQAVEDRRIRTTWAIAQQHVDQALDIADPIPNDKFRYHWRRKCYCWPRDLRR